MTTRRSLRLLAVVLFALLFGLGTGTALGHAELDTVTPADGSNPNSAPSEIVMTFTEPLEPAKSSIKLVTTNGKVVAEGSTVDTGDAKTMRLTLPADLAIGTFTARWTSASALDGDLDHGTTSFTFFAVGPIPGTPVPSALPSSPSASRSARASGTAPSVVPSPSPSSPPSTPTASTSDAIIPIVVVLIGILAVGAWLFRGRSGGGR